MKHVRRFLRGFLFLSLGLGGIWTALFYVQLGKPTELGRPLREIVLFRQDSVEQAPRPCILLAGGSNITYSYSALYVSDYVDDPVINFGLHAGLSLDYTLHLVAASVKAGDIVVLPLEYQHYGYNGRANSVLVDYLCGYDPDYVASMPLPEKARFIYAFNFWGLTEPSLSLVQRSLHRSQPIRSLRRGADVPYFDRHGDALFTERRRRREVDFRNVLAGQPARLDFDGKEESWTILSEFLEEMDARGVQVIHAWPVTRDFAAYASPEAQAGFRFIEDFFTAHGIPTLGTPEQYMFPAEEFFDTVYHLVQERRRTPSVRLGEALAAELRRE